MRHRNKNRSLVIRNFTFGVEDSLVSTLGLLVGIAVAKVDQSSIVITGLVLIFVEAFSMAVGSLLSEQSVEEYEQHREVAISKPIFASMVMFLSYVLSGLIPLGPFLFSSSHMAIWTSIIITLIALFMLGVFNARMFGVRIWKDGLQTLIMGGAAILVGIAVGQLANHL